jgi:cytoskeleton protein RodZ
MHLRRAKRNCFPVMLTMNDDPDLSGGEVSGGASEELIPDSAAEVLGEAGGATASRLRPGSRLKLAREALNLSLEDVAIQLKVAPRKIAALEGGQWSEMPERPYLRGLVRNYARVLHIDSERILADIDSDRGGVVAPGVFSLTPSLRAPFPQRTPSVHESTASRLMMIGVLICAAVICVIVFSKTQWFGRLEAMITASLHSTSIPAPSGTLASNDSERLNLSPHLAHADLPDPIHAGPAAANVVDAPAPASKVAPEGPAASPPPSRAVSDASRPVASAEKIGAGAAGTTALVLQFKDDSWVELRDADGKVSSQLYKGGTEQTLEVKPPVEVVIGNAPVVSLSYQGRTLDLDPYTHARVARLNLP